MSIQLGVELKDREAGELPVLGDRIVAFSPDNPDPLIKYRIMDAKLFRISTEARYWFSLEDLAIDELHKIKMGAK